MFKLRILFTNGKTKEITVKMFNYSSTDEPPIYYYERPFDEWGKGTIIPGDDVRCFSCDIESENKNECRTEKR